MAKKWTPAEEKYLLENYGKVPMAELADRFGVTRKAISAKLDKLRQAHGIDPVGARERAIQKTGKPVMSGARPPQPGGAVPRTMQLIDQIKHPKVDTLPTEAPAGKIPSGIVVKTDKGWHPVYIDKKRITS
jgi:biotin operon repressor